MGTTAANSGQGTGLMRGEEVVGGLTGGLLAKGHETIRGEWGQPKTIQCHSEQKQSSWTLRGHGELRLCMSPSAHRTSICKISYTNNRPITEYQESTLQIKQPAGHLIIIKLLLDSLIYNH